MTLLKKLQFKNTHTHFVALLTVFLFSHIFLLDINVAEWGDSYRILRASEYIRQGSYPTDEKRPPLFSFILSLRPTGMSPITFGRTVMLLISLASFVLFYNLAKEVGIKDSWLDWSALAFMLNNVYLYWSIRIMADVPFTLFVILVFYLLKRNFHNRGYNWLFLLGFVCGLSILTRFEGYILTACVLGFLVFEAKALNIKNIWLKTQSAIPFIVGVSAVLLPYIAYKNPLTSSYFEETSGRIYDLRMFSTYVVSLLGVLGLPPIMFVLTRNFPKMRTFLAENMFWTYFWVIELVLILAWPAAIPRLFVPIIPLIILYITIGLKDLFASKLSYKKELVTMGVLLGVYALGQYWLKLQFLLLDKKLFAVNILLQLIIIGTLAFRKVKWFMVFSVITMILWSYSIISMHKAIFSSVRYAAEYAGKNLSGNIGYNDVSSVTDWYLNYQYKSNEKTGTYYNTEKKQNLERQRLQESHLDYLLITNEHNTTMTIDLDKRPYLRLIKIFEYNVNGKVFVTRLVKVL